MQLRDLIGGISAGQGRLVDVFKKIASSPASRIVVRLQCALPSLAAPPHKHHRPLRSKTEALITTASRRLSIFHKTTGEAERSHRGTAQPPARSALGRPRSEPTETAACHEAAAK
ncbi:hypothetical protein GCM10027075_21400 [Streptomyces heilongjiangensis]